MLGVLVVEGDGVVEGDWVVMLVVEGDGVVVMCWVCWW